MINSTQSLIDALDDETIYHATTMLATLTRDEMLDPDEIRFIADECDTSPARCTRIAQILSHDESYTAIAHAIEFCPIHRCDYRICIDDEIAECSHLHR